MPSLFTNSTENIVNLKNDYKKKKDIFRLDTSSFYVNDSHTFYRPFSSAVGFFSKSAKYVFAEKLFLKSLSSLKFLFRRPILTILHKVISMSVSLIRIRPIKVGGITYRVPIYQKRSNQFFSSFRYLIREGCYPRSGFSVLISLPKEMYDALRGTGYTARRRTYLYALAKNNRLYTRYLKR